MKTKTSHLPLILAVVAATFFTTTEVRAEPRREAAPAMVILGTLPVHDRHAHRHQPYHAMSRHKKGVVCARPAHGQTVRVGVPQLRIEIVL